MQGLAWDAGARKLWAVDYQTDTIYQLVADDGTKLARFGGKDEILDLTQVVRNLGPGALRDASVVIAVPATRENQEVLSIAYDGPAPTFITDNQEQKLARFTAASVGAGAELQPHHARARAALRGAVVRLPGEGRPPGRGARGRAAALPRRRSQYQIGDPYIRKSAAEAVGGEKNPYWMARQLARYIDDRMRYEMAGGWESAPLTLKRGTGSCSEYTFAFVALARAVGLPARWVGAVVVRGDDASWDVDFHRWAEVYLPRYGWVPWDVQHADQPTPAGHAEPLGRLDDRMLVTTVSGGFSDRAGLELQRQRPLHLRGALPGHERRGRRVVAGRRRDAGLRAAAAPGRAPVAGPPPSPVAAPSAIVGGCGSRSPSSSPPPWPPAAAARAPRTTPASPSRGPRHRPP